MAATTMETAKGGSLKKPFGRSGAAVRQHVF
jgi:hypothetical protein